MCCPRAHGRAGAGCLGNAHQLAGEWRCVASRRHGGARRMLTWLPHPYRGRRVTAAALVSTVAASVLAPLIIRPSTLSRMVTHAEELQCRGGDCRPLPGPVPAAGAAVGLTGGAPAARAVACLEASAAATPRAYQADQSHRLPRSHRSGIESLQARASAPGFATRRVRYSRRQCTCPSAASLMVRIKEVEGRHLAPCAMNRVAASRTLSSCSVPTSAGSTADSARAHCCRVNTSESMWPSSLKDSIANVLRTTRTGAPPISSTIRLAMRTRCPARTGKAWLSGFRSIRVNVASARR
jgi:hypothetical protein